MRQGCKPGIFRLGAAWRGALLGIICGLSACVGISTQRTNNLPEMPGTQAAPVQMAFIVHVQHIKDPFDPDLARDSVRSETNAWVAALAPYADKRHIFVAVNDNRSNMPAELREFCRTHPVVDISDGDDPTRDKPGTSLRNFGATLLDLSTAGLTPLPLTFPYAAHFTLTLPAPPNAASGDKTQAVKLDYPFERRATPTPLYIIPNGDEFAFFWTVPISNNCCGGFAALAMTDWRTREKRKLIAQFLRDVRPLLDQYAQQVPAQEKQ